MSQKSLILKVKKKKEAKRNSAHRLTPFFGLALREDRKDKVAWLPRGKNKKVEPVSTVYLPERMQQQQQEEGKARR